MDSSKSDRDKFVESYKKCINSNMINNPHEFIISRNAIIRQYCNLHNKEEKKIEEFIQTLMTNMLFHDYIFQYSLKELSNHYSITTLLNVNGFIINIY